MKLKVSSRMERFRRAGFAFTKEAQEIDVDQKTFDILKAEPMLVVEEIEEPRPHTHGEQAPDPLPEGEGTKKKGTGK